MKVGRRPRRSTPMPRTTITAFVEQHVFLMLLGKGELSPGLQELVSTVSKDIRYPQYVKTMELAREMVVTARNGLGLDDDESSQGEILRYIKDNLLQNKLRELE
ncbi:MAG: hypothetical protein IAE79_07290 [Anaerolinea sp.]|nr:hypothetical protein [Anaerolinea sp.]